MKTFTKLQEALGVTVQNIMPAAFKSYLDSAALKMSRTMLGSVAEVFGQIEARLKDFGYTLNVSELEYPIAEVNEVVVREYPLFVKATGDIVVNVSLILSVEKLSGATQNAFSSKQRYDVEVKFIEREVSGIDDMVDGNTWTIAPDNFAPRSPQ